MKISKRVIRIRRKYVSIASVIFFISLGLVVTYTLNTQISKQKQTLQSRADCVDDDPERCAPEYSPQEPPARLPECKNTEERGGETICLDEVKSPNVPPGEEEEGGGCAGTCINVNNQSCSISTERGLCPGGYNIQCCNGYIGDGGDDDGGGSPPDNGSGPGDGQYIGKYCSTPQGEGSCEYTSSCDGKSVPGYCPGSSSVQCCVGGGGSDPGDPPVGGPGPDDQEPIKKPPPPPPDKDDPKGVVDQNDGHNIRGWAFDPNDTNDSIAIHIYIYPEGGAAEGYNTGPTSILRPDVNEAYGIAGIHGFDFSVPAKWCDGKTYTADVFAINVGDGGNTNLGGSSWSCSGSGQQPDSGQKPNDLSDRDKLLKQSFDGRWYLSEYTDVRRDKGYGKNSDTAFQHYLVHGMSEKRNSNADFDEKYYLDSNPDVVGGISRGEFRSGFEHYLIFGHKQPECRKPKSDANAPSPCGSNPDTQIQSNSSADVSVSLEGIGPGMTIKNPVRTADIKVISGAKTMHTASGFLTYDKVSGNFVNHDFKLGAIASGSYKLVIQMEGYLDKELLSPDGSGLFVLGEGKVSKTVPSQLSAGDNAPTRGGDNVVDIIDYNALTGCMRGSPSGACQNLRLSDLNDDGVVDQKDLDILKKNFGESGFLVQSDEFTCDANPACGSGKDSLQMCSLLCTKKSKRS